MNRREFVSALTAASFAAREDDTAARWSESFPARPPFSFVYGGRPSAALLPRWKAEVRTSPVDSARTRREVAYTDPATGLEARAVVTLYRDFPALEWVLHFTNTGRTDTPALADIQALDRTLRAPGGDPLIHHAKGAVCSMDDFMPLRRALNQGGHFRLRAGGGRSSSDYLPFFNLETRDGNGVMIGIGWSGEWAAAFTRQAGPEFRVRAGMDRTHLRLRPGEQIRTPLMLVLFWEGGDRLRGHNLLRRFILKYHRPSAAGKPVDMPLCNGNWGGTSAADHLENIRRIADHRLPMDYYWIDAEWFGKGPWHVNPGNWTVKKALYPDGFKPISEAARRAGLKLLLWFEPERVCEGTAWDREHRAWLLEVPKAKRVYNWGASQADPAWVVNESYRNQIRENDRLFDLGNPDARRYLTDFVSSRIEEFGLDCFRHDANIAPLEFWRAADVPDRQGMCEIRWVEGLYSFWDELLRRHPSLIIDNCASGGRRMDLESLSRTLPLWRTDFPAHPTAKQCHTHGLLHWVPLNATGAGNLSRNSRYPVRSSMSSGMNFGLFGRGDAPQQAAALSEFPFDEVRRTLEQYRSIQKYFYGDYYPLTEYSQAEDAWMAYQLDLPERREGLLVVLKRPLSPLLAASFPLRALAGDARYELLNLDSGESTRATGAELMQRGFELRLEEKPASALIRYRRLA